MPVVNSLAKIAAKPIPRVVSPRAHALIDYASVGLFIGATAFFWRRNRRAALASLICGGAELAMMLLTDYPGGVKRFLHFSAHREMDYGLAAIVATMPESLGFEDDDEKKFFLAQGALITVLGEVTQPSNATRRRAA